MYSSKSYIERLQLYPPQVKIVGIEGYNSTSNIMYSIPLVYHIIYIVLTRKLTPKNS